MREHRGLRNSAENGDEIFFFFSFSGGRFMTTAEQIRLPDDCTIGYIIGMDTGQS